MLIAFYWSLKVFVVGRRLAFMCPLNGGRVVEVAGAMFAAANVALGRLSTSTASTCVGRRSFCTWRRHPRCRSDGEGRRHGGVAVDMMALPPTSVVYAPRKSWGAGAGRGCRAASAPRRPGGASGTGRLALGKPHRPGADTPVRRHGYVAGGRSRHPELSTVRLHRQCRDVVIWNGGQHYMRGYHATGHHTFSGHRRRSRRTPLDWRWRRGRSGEGATNSGPFGLHFGFARAARAGATPRHCSTSEHREYLIAAGGGCLSLASVKGHRFAMSMGPLQWSWAVVIVVQCWGIVNVCRRVGARRGQRGWVFVAAGSYHLR